MIPRFYIGKLNHVLIKCENVQGKQSRLIWRGKRGEEKGMYMLSVQYILIWECLYVTQYHA